MNRGCLCSNCCTDASHCVVVPVLMISCMFHPILRSSSNTPCPCSLLIWQFRTHCAVPLLVQTSYIVIHCASLPVISDAFQCIGSICWMQSLHVSVLAVLCTCRHLCAAVSYCCGCRSRYPGHCHNVPLTSLPDYWISQHVFLYPGTKRLSKMYWKNE